MPALMTAGINWGVGHALPRTVVRFGARRGDLQSRLIVEGSTGADVSHLIEEIRGYGPLHRGRISYMTADHAAVREVLTSNDFHTGNPVRQEGVLGAIFDRTTPHVLHPLAPPSLLVTEPPDHTRYRKLVTRVFTVRAVEKLRGRTEEIATKLLDDLDPTSPVDLVHRYCSLLPVALIAEILGVPEADRPRVLEFGTAAAPSLDLGLDWATYKQVNAGLANFDTWLGGHLEKLRREPGDDLLSQLVAARDDDGTPLTEIELRATAGLVLAAGFETTVNLLSNGTALLTGHRDQLARLQAEPELWPNAVDEVLRFDPPVLLTGRICSRDTEIVGVPVPEGKQVVTLLAGANRDPKVFCDPHTFDVGRENARDHMSFSGGRHYCLGASLARMEGEVGLRALFDRFPDLQVLPGAERRPTRILRGFEHLPVRLQP